MAMRLIEILAPTAREEHLRAIVERAEPWACWRQASGDSLQLKVVLPSEMVEEVLDPLQSYVELHGDVRVAVLSVQAFLPRPAEEEEQRPVSAPKKIGRTRVSREELLSELQKGTEVTGVFVTTVVLSTIVAAIGLWKNSPAIIIGAMVIAPLIGPNMSLALATTLGDGSLARRSLGANLTGLGIAAGVASLMGLAWHLPVLSTEVVARTQPTFADIGLALAAGAAGALAFTTGVSTALVGVMVAVALLPPLVVACMLIGVSPRGAMNAFVLLAINVICINLAAVATFALQGVRPRTWWDTQRSKRATRIALTVWMVLLATVIAIVVSLAPATG